MKDPRFYGFAPLVVAYVWRSYRLKPYYDSRPDRALQQSPVTDPGQEGEYVVQQLLNRRTIRGRTHYLSEAGAVVGAGAHG